MGGKPEDVECGLVYSPVSEAMSNLGYPFVT
jgi:hypothetical protein